MLSIILIIILVLLLIGAFPRWPYNRGWGYSPFNILVILLIILIILMIFNVI